MGDVTLLSLLRRPLLDSPVNIFPLKCSEILAEAPFLELTLVLALAMHASNSVLIPSRIMVEQPWNTPSVEIVFSYHVGPDTLE